MPQHAAELDRRAVPRVAARAERRSAPAQQATDPATEAVQRVLDDSPRVAALEQMGEALAQRRVADGPVVQRRVGPEEGRPGMEVVLRGSGVRGSLVRAATGESGEAVGWVVMTSSGTQNVTFDEVDPAPSLASSLLLSSLLPPSSLLPTTPPTLSSPGSSLLTPIDRGSPPVLTGGTPSSNPLLSAPSPSPVVVTGSGRESAPTSSVSAPAEEDSVAREGDGVQVTLDGKNWHDGYLTLIDGPTYHVYLDGLIIRQHFAQSTVQVPAEQVRTTPAIKRRLGTKRTKRSKREYRPDQLASFEQLREVQGLSAAVSPLLLRHPVLFGPVLRSGGHIGTSAVSAVGKLLGLSVTMPLGTKGKARNRPLENAIVATDTNAMLLTRLDDTTSSRPGQWVLHGKAATNEAADHPTLNETQLGAMRSVDLAAFRRQFVFSQGSIKGESVSGMGRRTQMHAEAKAVRSRTWRHIIDQTVAEFTLPPSGSSVSASEPVETRRKVIAIAINRSSCGSPRKGSGFTGGCALELAEVIAAFWTELGARLGEERAARLRAQGLIRIEVSAAGQYENEGKIERTAAAGARLALHPNYDFDRDMPEPLSVARYQYMKRLALINAGRVSGSDSGSGEEEEETELDRLLALLAAQRGPVRRPTASVSLPVGQHQVHGMLNRRHTGRIACTSIAACALEQMLNSPGQAVNQRTLMDFMSTGTDIDADLRRDLRAAQVLVRSGSRDESAPRAFKRRATADLVGPGPEPPLSLSGSLLPFSGSPFTLSGPPRSFSGFSPSFAAFLASLPSGMSGPPVFPPLPLIDRVLPSPALERLLMPPPPPRILMPPPLPSMLLPPPPPPGMLVESRPPVSSPVPSSGGPSVSVVSTEEPPTTSSSLFSLLPSPSLLPSSSGTSGMSGPLTTTTASAPLESSGKKRTRKRTRRPSGEEPPEERYFAHDEVQAQFPGMQVDQAAIDAEGPQYLNGVRGDYRRIARQLTRGGPRTGMLVTIGGATIMVANLSTMTRTRFALFDSHGQAIFEIYDSEQGLADAIDDLYPDLPGVDEMDVAWYATPYRPT